MPLPPRPDIRPEIWLLDTTVSQQRVNSVIRANENARVRRARALSDDDMYYATFNTFREVQEDLIRRKVPIDWGLLDAIKSRCDFAKATPVVGKNGMPISKNGLLLHRMVAVGCRARFKQDEIACQLNLSRSHVCKQIGLLRDHHIIVNDGHGWYELDARYFWRGQPELREAYIAIQQGFTETVVTDGKTSAVMHLPLVSGQVSASV